MKILWNVPPVEFLRLEEVEEKRPVLVVTSRPAWLAAGRCLSGLNATGVVEVSQRTLAHWDHLLADPAVPRSAVIYAVGGGLAADAAKYLAVRLGLPLVCVPTALSVDAFLTWASGVREDGCVRYIETRPPDRLLVDFAIIGAAPAVIRAAGISDVLSIATGLWDWQFAERQGQNPPEMRYLSWAGAVAEGILASALECAEAAGRGDPDGLKQLLDCLALEVQLCNQIGHSRPEEGSEHYFAYAVENLLAPGLPHGDLVGPGILLMAEKQGQAVETLRRALQACHIPLDHISLSVIEQIFRILPGYCSRHHLPFGLAHTF